MTERVMPNTYRALCFDMSRMVAADDGIWLPMIPAGIFSGRDGRTWNNSNPDAVVAAFDQKLPFDIEHATEVGIGETDAVGWLLELQNRAGEIWSRVEWNAEGREKIDEKKFGFYSPAFECDALGTVLAMASAGLTNKPNLRVPALNREETTMPLPVELTQALGLPADAETPAALTAINTLKADHQLALNRANSPDLSKFVPKETYELALNRATTAEAKVKDADDAKLGALVDDAIAAGKIAPANRDMFLGMCRAEGGVEQFTAFVASAPVIADGNKVKGKDNPQGAELSKDELALCRAMGVEPKTWLASRHHKPTY